MAYEQRDNSGALFKNNKEGNEKRPDYRGDCTVNGQPMRISAWVKDGRSGKFLSLKFEPPREKPAAPRPTPTTPDAFDDEIPF